MQIIYYKVSKDLEVLNNKKTIIYHNIKQGINTQTE